MASKIHSHLINYHWQESHTNLPLIYHRNHERWPCRRCARPSSSTGFPAPSNHYPCNCKYNETWWLDVLKCSQVEHQLLWPVTNVMVLELDIVTLSTINQLINLGRHCVSLRHRRGPDIPNLYQLLPTSTNQPKHTGNLAIIEFLCLSSNNNHEITDPLTCRQMSCRFGHPADTTSSRVADMTETCRRHVADTTQNVAVWATKRHADIRHMELREAKSIKI